ncbi:MAG: CDP-alcohol phosphatidyltransferase family protein [Candidatus Latescibacterota bacterium]|nr:MAG: CDP-alcohol phosphatidyltransferase family protein [Candidatus Latescibacterota bacterium]
MLGTLFKSGFARMLRPITWVLVRVRVHPDIITAIGVAGSIAAAVMFAKGRLALAGAIVLLAGLCDVLDGEVARMGRRGSKFGALLDSTMDRYSEIFVAFGILWYFFRQGWLWTSGVLFFTLTGSLMVSYVRARAEGLGEECTVGLMQRAERVICIAAGALIGPKALAAAIWAIAVLANFTVGERLWHVWKRTRRLELNEGQ